MKKISVLLLFGLMMVTGITPGYAHESKGHASPKHVIRELNEAKEILGKLTPDAGGHVARASQDVEQAIQELSAVKDEPKVKPGKKK